MVHSTFVENMDKIKKATPIIEDKIKIKLSFEGRKVRIKGSELNEFIVEKAIEAIDFGFDAEDAMVLKNPNFTLNFINIKEHTNKKNLKEVRSRVIGTDGRAKGTIEELTNSKIVIHENTIGIIVHADHLDTAIQGLISLIQGSKHSNVFKYLEKQNAHLRKLDSDLGLKDENDQI